ncbi:3-beta-hydroxysteroid-Delta(8),Delta(7)-isomerase, partial [Ophiophagus hannah]
MRSVWCKRFVDRFLPEETLAFFTGSTHIFSTIMVLEAKAVVHHPYRPQNLELKNYVPNDKPVWQILTYFFSIVGILMILGWFVAGWRSKTWGPFGTWRTLIICWFTVCVFIHCVFEGWFVLYYMEIPGDQSILSQI